MHSTDIGGPGAAGYVKQTDSSKWHHIHVEDISVVFAQGSAARSNQQTRAIILQSPHDLLFLPTDFVPYTKNNNALLGMTTEIATNAYRKYPQ